MFKRKCRCENYTIVNIFYEEYLSVYNNRYDSISIYERRKCNVCQKEDVSLIGTKEFRDDKHNELKRFKNYLHELGIYDKLTNDMNKALYKFKGDI